MRIDVVSDVICPWCYIGKRRLASALQQRPEVDADILWHPFQLNPDMPPEGMARERYIAAKFGGGQHANRIYQNVTEVGATVGIPFHFERIQVTPSTSSPVAPTLIGGTGPAVLVAGAGVGLVFSAPGVAPPVTRPGVAVA